MINENEIIKAASNCNPKIKEDKDFKQVWFTRGEVQKLIKLVAEECMAQCNEVRDNAAIVDPADPVRVRDETAMDHICMGANSSKYRIAKAFGIDVTKTW